MHQTNQHSEPRCLREREHLTRQHQDGRRTQPALCTERYQNWQAVRQLQSRNHTPSWRLDKIVTGADGTRMQHVDWAAPNRSQRAPAATSHTQLESISLSTRQTTPNRGCREFTMSSQSSAFSWRKRSSTSCSKVTYFHHRRSALAAMHSCNSTGRSCSVRFAILPF